MKIGILETKTGMPGYYAEILQTWGLRSFALVKEADIRDLDARQTPVLIVPAGLANGAVVQALDGYMSRQGTVIAICPESALAALAGLGIKADYTQPLRLRLSALPGTGLAGEPVPVVGKARTYAGLVTPGQALAHLWEPGSPDDLGPGILKVTIGKGRMMVFAFDLALSVHRCRQGDPAKTGRIPENAPKGNEGCRAVNMVMDVGPGEPASIPYADALAKAFVEVVRMSLPCPAPMLWHLPGQATGIVLYSGDEDWSPIHMIDGQMESITSAGGRMNLYIIPENTNSTPADFARYLEHHDLGPHPNLRPCDDWTLPAKLDEFTRQIKLVETMTGVKTRSLRNHHVVWIGYTEQADRMAELGIRMDGNYNYGSYLRSRDPGAFAGWGAGMPMRFFAVDGRSIDVMQQHTHVGDDQTFSNLETPYSYRITPEIYAAQVHLTLSDAQDRFHVPYAVNIHPSNWGKFSKGHSDTLLEQSRARGVPVYSFDQWSLFWDARDTWRCVSQTWTDGVLTWRWEGQKTPAGLSGYLPATANGKRISKLTINGKDQPLKVTRRHLLEVVAFDLPADATAVEGAAQYV
jgi:hypothetical protein